MEVGGPRHAPGHPTYHVNVINLKYEIIWTSGLPHLSGYTYVGSPNLHVNRPLDRYFKQENHLLYLPYLGVT